jgi:hypothetical protein
MLALSGNFLRQYSLHDMESAATPDHFHSLRYLHDPSASLPDLMSNPISRVAHPNFNSDSCFRDRELSGERLDQMSGNLKGIGQFLAPGGVVRVALLRQPDLNDISGVFLADACKQVCVARITRFRLHQKLARLHEISDQLLFLAVTPTEFALPIPLTSRLKSARAGSLGVCRDGSERADQNRTDEGECGYEAEYVKARYCQCHVDLLGDQRVK